MTLEPTPLEIKIGGLPLDLWIQDKFFDFETGKWCVDSDNRLGKFLFYKAPKMLVIIPIAIAVLVCACIPRAVWTRCRRENRGFANRRRLVLCLICLALIPLVCAQLKAVTNVYCPGGMTRYGGKVLHIRVLESYPPEFAAWQKENNESGRCFPAGHASGGFALMSLALLSTRRRHQVLLISLGIFMGWLMGGYQMLRGVHYFSHTITTWGIAAFFVSLAAKFLPNKPRVVIKNTP